MLYAFIFIFLSSKKISDFFFDEFYDYSSSIPFIIAVMASILVLLLDFSENTSNFCLTGLMYYVCM